MKKECVPEPSREIVKLRLDELKIYPRQDELFPMHLPAEDAALAEDIKENGLQHPIEVLPNQTILAGHRRAEAALELGWTEIDAIIRYDLEEKGDRAIQEYVIHDNFHRRQLSRLDRARCTKRLIELETERSQHESFDWQRNGTNRQIQKRVAALLRISDREVRRILRVLDAPIEVQTAYESGKLDIDLAGRTAGLDEDVQQEIADAIADAITKDEDPRQVVQDYVTENTVQRRGILPFYRKFLENLTTAVDALDGRVEDLDLNPALADDHIVTLKRAATLIDIILERELRNKQEQDGACIADEPFGHDVPDDGRGCPRI